MEWISGELSKVLFTLLPGFLTAWVFHSLTAHRVKREVLERVIQALIFTALVRAVLPGAHGLWTIATEHLPLRPWDEEISNGAAIIIAMLMGVVFALFANHGWFHAFMRWLKVTKRTSHPSEWFSAFNSDKRFVILHFKEGGPRLSGWPEEWPDHPDTGHFLLCDAEWLDDDGNKTVLSTVEFLVIPVELVKFVEVEKRPGEIGKAIPECADESPCPALGADNGKHAETTKQPERITARVDGQASGGPAPPVATTTTTAQNQMNHRSRRKGRR